MRRLLLLLLFWPGSWLIAQSDFPGTDDKWRHFRSANFELYSRNRESDSRELLHDLELFRAMFLGSFKLEERRRTEVTVYYFKSEKDFRAYVNEIYGPKNNFDGIYVDGIDRAIICLIPGEDADGSRQLIFHEYGHHLFRVTEQNPPPWFNEGMAELFSTVQAKGGKMEFGHPVVGRLWQLKTEKLMPLEQLFAVEQSSPIFRQGEHTGLFYAESWALLHYLYFGDSKIPAGKRQTFVRLALANQFKDAADMRAIFRDVFGMDYPEMLARLERYVSGGSYFWGKNPLPEVPPTASYAGRKVPREEIRLRLAELALRMSRSPSAKLALLQAVGTNPDDTRSLEALGADAWRDQDELTVWERWRQAAKAGTRNPAIYRELGLMESHAMFARFDAYFRVPAESAERLRGYLLRSIEYNPEQTDAYEMLSWVEAFAPEPDLKNVRLVQQKYPQMTRKDRTALALAFVRVRVDQKSDARKMLTDLESMRPDDWVVYGIEATRAYIEGRPIRCENLRLAAPTQPGRIKVPEPKTTPPSRENN